MKIKEIVCFLILLMFITTFLNSYFLFSNYLSLEPKTLPRFWLQMGEETSFFKKKQKIKLILEEILIKNQININKIKPSQSNSSILGLKEFCFVTPVFLKDNNTMWGKHYFSNYILTKKEESRMVKDLTIVFERKEKEKNESRFRKIKKEGNYFSDAYFDFLIGYYSCLIGGFSQMIIIEEDVEIDFDLNLSEIIFLIKNNKFITGSFYMGKMNTKLMYKMHINGNAIYNLFSPCWQIYFKSNWKQWPYDVAFYAYMIENKTECIYEYKYSDKICNFYETEVTKKCFMAHLGGKRGINAKLDGKIVDWEYPLKRQKNM